MLELADLVAALPGCRVHGHSQRFGKVTINSRDVTSGDLFFALRGDRDGHDFVPDAAKAGAAGVVVDHDVAGLPAGLTVVTVPDTLEALQGLGAAARRRTAASLIAVTGSAGKTTTKDMVACVLSGQFDVHSSAKSYNNHLGVPLTLLSAQPGDTHVVVEIGTNHRGEIDRLASLVAPDVGIVTNVGFAHVGNFRDQVELSDEKADLLRHVRKGGTWVVNGDDEVLMSAVARLPAEDVTVVTFGFNEGCSLRAVDVSFSEEGTSGAVLVEGARVPFSVSASGRPFVYAALIALAVGRIYDIDLAMGVKALRAFQPPRGRANLSRSHGGPLLIDDSYNASPDATLAALDLLASLEAKVKLAVLGEMRELGAESPRLHALVGQAAANAATHLVVVGEGGRALLEAAGLSGFPSNQTWYRDSARDALEVAREVVRTAGAEAAVLVKGARFTHMERVLLGLSGRKVTCALGTCTLYINCSACPELEA